MIKAAEGAGVGPGLGMRCRESMLRRSRAVETRTAAVKSASAMKSSGAIEGVMVDEDSTVGDISVVVVDDSVVMPVISPVVPAPAESTIEADSKAEAKCNSRTAKVESGIRIPSRPDPDRSSIHEPGIILRHVDNLRVCRLDHDGLPLLAHLFLRCAL